MDAADIIVIGESHTDAQGHQFQVEIIKAAVRRWPGITISLEEFDRAQQAALDAYSAGRDTADDLEALRAFVNLRVRQNWRDWYLPKLEAAREGKAVLIASNAPLRYSRLVRNVGCDKLPDLDAAERALFDCPVAPEDPAYRQRFANSLKFATANSESGLKPLQTEQIDLMFRAQRVWDATMAQSVAGARARNNAKVLHLVGNVHSDFNGGLLQELRVRDKSARLLVISLRPVRSDRFLPSDRGRADIVVYTH